jgi:hypothetical protein
MSVAEWTPADTKRAQQIWAEFAAQNDLSSCMGQAAGIDPASGRIWFGESASDIFHQLKASGEAVPLFFVRVGQPSYLRKGGHR